MAASGDVVAPLDERATIALIDRLVEEKGVDSIAVCFLHA
jgi:N-methylhydantoinase A/oxoprolinase/acetone carboxylase beta subunit